MCFTEAKRFALTFLQLQFSNFRITFASVLQNRVSHSFIFHLLMVALNPIEINASLVRYLARTLLLLRYLLSCPILGH